MGHDLDCDREGQRKIYWDDVAPARTGCYGWVKKDGKVSPGRQWAWARASPLSLFNVLLVGADVARGGDVTPPRGWRPH